MEPFTITCNQCHSEEVLYNLVGGNKLTIYCEHCPANYTVALLSPFGKKPAPPQASQPEAEQIRFDME